MKSELYFVVRWTARWLQLHILFTSKHKLKRFYL